MSVVRERPVAEQGPTKQEQVQALAQAASDSGSHGKLSIYHWELVIDALHAAGWKLSR